MQKEPMIGRMLVDHIGQVGVPDLHHTPQLQRPYIAIMCPELQEHEN